MQMNKYKLGNFYTTYIRESKKEMFTFETLNYLN